LNAGAESSCCSAGSKAATDPGPCGFGETNISPEHIKITPTRVSQALVDQWLPGSKVGDYVAPATIEAQKPLT